MKNVKKVKVDKAGLNIENVSVEKGETEKEDTDAVKVSVRASVAVKKASRP